MNLSVTNASLAILPRTIGDQPRFLREPATRIAVARKSFMTGLRCRRRGHSVVFSLVT